MSLLTSEYQKNSWKHLVFRIYLTRERRRIIVFQVVQNDFSVFTLPTRIWHRHFILLLVFRHSPSHYAHRVVPKPSKVFSEKFCVLWQTAVFICGFCTYGSGQLLIENVIFLLMCMQLGVWWLTYTHSRLSCHSLGIIFNNTHTHTLSSRPLSLS